MTTPSPSARFVAREDVLAREVDGETVLLDIRTERYLGLNEVGSAIWQELQEARSIDDIVEHLCEHFDAARATLEADAKRFVGELLDRDLITPQ